MTKLSGELVAANAALSSALVQSTLETTMETSQQLGRAPQEALLMGATIMEFAAKHLLSFIEFAKLEVSREDSNFAYRVVCSSSVILLLDSASRACTFKESGDDALKIHNEALRQLFRTLRALGEGQPSAFRVLRATACSSEAICACIRRLLSPVEYWNGGQGANEAADPQNLELV